MKIASTLAAAVVGAFLFAGGAQAAPLSASGALTDIAASSTLTEPVACRTVTKRVCTRGHCRVSRSRICTPTPRHHACRSVSKRTCVAGRCRSVTRRVCY